jgi:hypothetical protein
MTVLLLFLTIFLRLGLLSHWIFIPLFELARVFNVGFQVSDCSAVWT